MLTWAVQGAWSRRWEAAACRHGPMGGVQAARPWLVLVVPRCSEQFEKHSTQNRKISS